MRCGSGTDIVSQPLIVTKGVLTFPKRTLKESVWCAIVANTLRRAATGNATPTLEIGKVGSRRRNRKVLALGSRAAPYPSIPPRRTSNASRRSREYLTPAEVEELLQGIVSPSTNRSRVVKGSVRRLEWQLMINCYFSGRDSAMTERTPPGRANWPRMTNKSTAKRSMSRIVEAGDQGSRPVPDCSAIPAHAMFRELAPDRLN